MMDNKGSEYPDSFQQPPPPYEENENAPPIPSYQYQPLSMPPTNYPDTTVIVMEFTHAQMHQNPVGRIPPNYKGLAVFVTMCCCLPIGLFATKKSNEVETLYNMGNYMGALKASRDTFRYSVLGLCLGILLSSVLAAGLTAMGTSGLLY